VCRLATVKGAGLSLKKLIKIRVFTTRFDIVKSGRS
jgi:hypothetical protein